MAQLAKLATDHGFDECAQIFGQALNIELGLNFQAAEVRPPRAGTTGFLKPWTETPEEDEMMYDVLALMRAEKEPAPPKVRKRLQAALKLLRRATQEQRRHRLHAIEMGTVDDYRDAAVVRLARAGKIIKVHCGNAEDGRIRRQRNAYQRQGEWRTEMTGSITKYTVKGSSWSRWRYRICVGKAALGRYMYEGGAGLEKQADADEANRLHIARFNARMIETRQPPEARQPVCKETLATWLPSWLDTFAVDRCEQKTLERYRQLAKYVYAGPAEELTLLAKMPLCDLRRPQLRSAFYALLRAKGKRRKHISKRTVRHVAGVVSVALSDAVEQELLPSNPMLRLKLPTI